MERQGLITETDVVGGHGAAELARGFKIDRVVTGRRAAVYADLGPLRGAIGVVGGSSTVGRHDGHVSSVPW